MKANQILEAGMDILVSRAKEYDPSAEEERNMAQIVRVFNAFYPGTVMTESQGWHFMDILKKVRGIGAPEFHKDSFIDASNYTALMGEAMATEKNTWKPIKSKGAFHEDAKIVCTFRLGDKFDIAFSNMGYVMFKCRAGGHWVTNVANLQLLWLGHKFIDLALDGAVTCKSIESFIAPVIAERLKNQQSSGAISSKFNFTEEHLKEIQ